MTAAVMAAFGASTVDVGERQDHRHPGPLRGHGTRPVEPDASSASYPLAATAIACGTATVAGMGHGALQGDARFADLLAAMGARPPSRWPAPPCATPAPLHGIDVDMVDMSDLVPTLAAVSRCWPIRPPRSPAASASSTPRRATAWVTSAPSWHLGADVTETGDGLAIRPAPLAAPTWAPTTITAWGWPSG